MDKCYICKENIEVTLDNALYAYKKDEKLVTVAHVSCLKENDLDVCSSCMDIVPIANIVDIYHTCKTCDENKKPLVQS
jgi:hypothetical protein